MSSASASEDDYTLETEEERVTRLLNDLEANHTDTDTWEELIDCIHHQGSIYAETLPAMPRLTTFATTWPLAECVEPLILLGHVVASANSGPEDTRAEMRRSYAGQLSSLIPRVKECLAAPEVYNKEEEENGILFVYLLSALLAFEGESQWDEKIEALVNGEYNLECPECGNYTYIVVDAEGGFAAAEHYISVEDTPRVPLVPATSEELNPLGSRLYGLAKRQKREVLAMHLLQLFGSAKCPACEKVFSIEKPLLKD